MSALDPNGPKVVAIGGGHGLASTLRAARRYAGEITAVVSVADDGGSTGRLRQIQDRAAPGDLRKCLVALAERDSLLARTLDRRFGAGALEGHAVGNLLIAGLEEEAGDLVAAVDEVGRLLGCVGRVRPATGHAVQLVATTVDGRTVRGQVEVMATEGIDRVYLDPADPPAPECVVQALERADQIVIGPGSLYTSVLAALAVPAVRRAITVRPERTVYVCNLRPQAGETAGFALDDHEAALGRHGVEPHVVLVDPAAWPEAHRSARCVAAPLSRDAATHDPELLARALASVVRPS